MSAPDAPALFRRDGEHFIPGDAAPGPWSPNALHGGSVCGLLAHCLGREVAGAQLLPTRLTVDLFRAVPKAPLKVTTRRVRDGRRIKSVDASLLHEGTEVARASALFLLRTEGELNEPWPFSLPPGPEGIETMSLMGTPRVALDRPRGFHTTIESRWTGRREEGGRAAWFRMPGALIEGEPLSPLVRAAALGDFANAGKPPCCFGSADKRAAHYREMQATVEVYAERSECYRAGERSVRFPSGTYPPPVLAAAA